MMGPGLVGRFTLESLAARRGVFGVVMMPILPASDITVWASHHNNSTSSIYKGADGVTPDARRMLLGIGGTTNSALMF